MRSKLEECVAAALEKSNIHTLYEPYTLPVTITIQSQPDFWLPDTRTVVEVKGKCSTYYDYAKLVQTHETVKQGVLYEDITYTKYVVAVQTNPQEHTQYVNSLFEINQLVRTLQRGSFPLYGLRLVAALQRAGVTAIPVTHSKVSLLMRELKRGERDVKS